MAGKRRRRVTAALQKETAGPAVPETAERMLADALENGLDFILTFAEGEEGGRYVHIMTGSLITPCMLGTLTNRCGMPEPGGCRHIVVRYGSGLSGRKPRKDPEPF